MADGITKEEMRDLLLEQAQVFKGAIPATTSSTSSIDTNSLQGEIDKTTKGFNPFSDALSKVGTAVHAAGEAYTAVSSVIKPGLDTWRNLSGTGASFSNDIVGMSAAASGARLDLSDFASVIKNNSASLIGLGGNAAKGAENFALLSKEMADNGATESLKQIGYTNKDLNDILALQVGFQRGSFKDTKEGHEESIRAASELATQMDAMAKLTGKTRAEQEDALKKAQADAQVEAKFRLIGATQGPEAEAKARLAFTAQYNEAQLRGQGQMFKEVFATGQVVSQEAANQAALEGRAAAATAAQARATAAGDTAAASAYSKQAQEEQLKNSKNTTLLTIATYGEVAGAAGTASKNIVTNSQGIYDAAAKIRQESEFKNATDAQVLAEAQRRIRAEQDNKDLDGAKKRGAATTEAIVALENRTKELNSALMNGLVVPLNKDVGPGIRHFTETYLGPNVVRTTPTGTETVTRAKAEEESIRRGFEEGISPNTGKPTTVKEKILNAGPGEGYFGGDTLKSIGNITGTIEKAVLSVTGILNIDGQAMKAHAEGAIINEPEVALIGEAGKEFVIPDNKMQNLMQNVRADSLSSMISALKSKEENQNKQEQSAVPTAQVTDYKPSVPADSITMKDLHGVMQELNKNMMRMVSHAETISDASQKQVKATKGLSNNRFAF
jgi:hypothetical protein